jgi:hypothetical protein
MPAWKGPALPLKDLSKNSESRLDAALNKATVGQEIDMM